MCSSDLLGVEICIPAGKPAVQGNIGLWYQKREDRRTSDYRKRLFLQAWHNPVQPGTCRQVYFTPQDTTCVKWGSWCDNEACVGCDPAAWSRNSVQFLLLAEDSRVAQNDLTIELRPLQYHQGEGCTCTKVPPGSCPQGLACDVLANGVPDARCEPGVRCRGVCSQ